MPAEPAPPYQTAPTPRQGRRRAYETDPDIPPAAVPPPPVLLPPAYTAPPEPPPARDAPLTGYVTRSPAPAPAPPAYTAPAEAPLTGYVTRRPTPPIPSAARSRKPPPKPPPESRAGRLRLRVNPITCDGHGLCAELLPELLSVDDWGYPSPVVAEVPSELEGHAQRAAQQCPTLAIVLERRRPIGKDGTA